MNLTLSYVKDRLLKAGSLLQHTVAQIPDGEQYQRVHDAQNQLALALAALVQIEHDGIITNATPVSNSYLATLPKVKVRAAEVIAWLRDESDELSGIAASAKKYTNNEQGVLLRAAALLESLHPSLLEE